jgi:hypothetical protein
MAPIHHRQKLPEIQKKNAKDIWNKRRYLEKPLELVTPTWVYDQLFSFSLSLSQTSKEIHKIVERSILFTTIPTGLTYTHTEKSQRAQVNGDICTTRVRVSPALKPAQTSISTFFFGRETVFLPIDGDERAH